jgi:uncharacterized membrane protein
MKEFYMNEIQIKERAKEIMNQQMGNLIMAFIIYGLVSSGISTLTFGMAWIFIYGPLSLGAANILLKADKGESFAFEEVLSGFRDFGKALLAGVLTSLYIFLWSLLLFIPGIVAALSYSMTFFIMSENPQLSAEQAIEASKRMMVGHKTELFSLIISFIGWWILCIISMGIAAIYVAPYFHCSLTVFYQNLKYTQK